MLEPLGTKTVQMVRCPFCCEYHRVNTLLESKTSKCPETRKTFTPDPKDWLQISEDEFRRRFISE